MLPLMRVAAANRLVMQKQQYLQRQASQLSTRRTNNYNMRSKNSSYNLNNENQFDKYSKSIRALTPPPSTQQQIRVSRLIKAADSFEIKNKIHDGTTNCNTCHRLSLTNNNKKAIQDKRTETDSQLGKAITKLSGGIGQIIAHHAL